MDFSRPPCSRFVPSFFIFHAHSALQVIHRDGVIALKAFHRNVPGDLHDHSIRNSFSAHPGNKTVSEIVEPEVFNIGFFTCDTESGLDASYTDRKDKKS